jgi:hypothetical protein
LLWVRKPELKLGFAGRDLGDKVKE